MAPPVDRLDSLPDAIARIDVRDIRRVFPNPTLVHVRGELDPPLFISTLLHGNETTGFLVLRRLCEMLAEAPPRRSLMIFIGNVAAVEADRRRLDGEPDFNRIWAHGDTAHHRMAAQVLEAARDEGLFASIDVHNNTGANPLYGCVNCLRPEDLHLAASFAPVGVYYINPPTTQSMAFSNLCPAITLECGQPGEAAGFAAAVRLIDHVLSLERFPETPPPDGALRLFETVGRVLIDPSARVSFGPAAGADLVFREDLEKLNFTEIAAGAHWASCDRAAAPMRVVDEHGGDLTGAFFRRDGDDVFLKQTVFPAMITHDHTIIRQDCLCYLMKPIRRASDC